MHKEKSTASAVLFYAKSGVRCYNKTRSISIGKACIYNEVKCYGDFI